MILLHSHISQVTTEEGQSKITNTESVFKSSRKDAMIDNVEGSAQIQQSHNGDWARIWSGQEVTENTKETELSQYCGGLTKRCNKDSFDPDNKKAR